MKKRLLILSDTHCGSTVGMMPPNFSFKEQKFIQNEFQRTLWKKFADEINQLRPIDVCLFNGDAVDGRGERSGSTEVWSADRNLQVLCAKELLDFVDAKHYVLTYGTRYHTGNTGEDYEDVLNELMHTSGKDTRIKSQAFFSINGLVFHAKHKIGSSSIPHGRFTPLARQKTWNLFWSEFGEVPKADIFIRSHVHYFDYCGGYKWLSVITPALQGWGTKFGNRECEGTIDWGFIYFDIVDKSHWMWKPVVDRNVQHTEVIEFNTTEPIEEL